MSIRVVLALVGVAGIVAGCSATTDAPPPPTTASTTTSTFTPGSVVITTSSTSMPSTTIDRVAEITAIFEDLERRRLQALFAHDEAAFRETFSNERYMEESMVLLELDSFVADPSNVELRIVSVLTDSEDCIAAVIEVDLSGITREGGRGTSQQVIEKVDGTWGISYAGGDWACDGPHPLS